MNKSAAFVSKCALSACFFWMSSVSAFEPAQAPLILGGQVEPNVTFILDDSGSMRWGYMPDSLRDQFSLTGCFYVNSYAGVNTVSCEEASNRFLMSSAFNTLYYDPAITYLPPLKEDGTKYSAATYDNAWVNGYAQGGTTINLASNYRGIMDDYFLNWGNGYSGLVIGAAGGGRYYNFKSTCQASSKYDNACYDITFIGTDAARRQNFANWFSYYRTRILAAKSGVSAAFYPQTSAIRVGWGSINKGSTSIDGISTRTVSAGVRPFSGTSRQSFFNWIRDFQPSGSTPLRQALDDAGQYYSRTDDKGPWSTTPGVTGGKDYACRQSYTMLTTDGYWNGNQASTAAARKDVDGDGVANTLADVAKHYWETDLYGTLANNVPTSLLNKQNQQHMVTIGVGLGLQGDISPTKQQAFDAVISGTENGLKWPDPIASEGEARLLDLLHASANGRGDFFNAQNPVEFAEALATSLVNIADLAASNTPRAVSSARLTSDTLLYEASYESGNWAGSLKAYKPSETATGLQYDLQWEAGAKLPESSRKFIYGASFGKAKAVAMTWGNVNQAFFSNDQDLFNYIKGNRLDEDPNGRAFRARGSLLGDIVNSSVVAVNRRDFGYLPSRTGLAGYEEFLKAKKARSPVVYAGANDGFLHAFDGTNGTELFAFMPHGVAANVKGLADKNYQHRYFVDGKIHEHDVFIATPADAAKKWRTVLVGGLGAGGKSIYALDVTNASSFGPENVLWEFSDVDMGHSFGEPVVGLLANGQWGAIFGNGYGTKSDGTPLNSVLYVVNLETGALIDKEVLATGTGGLASPGYVYSPSGDTKAFAVANIYVGDLGGNLWKLNANNNGSFTTAFNGTPLFKAIHGSGTSAKPQPITVRPLVAAHPKVTDTHMVYFGTGSFASYADISSQRINEVQSVYGIWGNGVPSGKNQFNAITSRSALDQVKITAEYSSGGFDALNPELKSDMRLVEEKTEIDWTNKGGWYLDLLTKGITPEGERVVSQPEIIRNSLVFKTNLPSDNPCLPDDNGWLMAMDLATGGRLSYTVWDYNRDGVVDKKDDLLVADGDPSKGTGIRGDGILPTGGLLIGDTKCYYYGMVVNCDARPASRRVSWEQVDEE